ncbi:c-type cytochrome [Haematospirillum sp. H1815]|uniref:c-type cytochrome n=1 Tax=Haematospirillum sp. H1815 TaxID=2723108 RepID=UPI00143C606A|nr:c-type cytochrome [Haematospirillum sp. H1815]NKD76348.1 c-type cytochrome [Haematospirillum sp. H1815]
MIFRVSVTSLVAGLLFVSGSVMAQDLAAGEKIAKSRCAACHSFDKGGAHKVGPNLFGITTRGPAKATGYAYSTGLTDAATKGFAWDKAELDTYLTDPSKFLEQKTGDAKVRSKMTFKLPKADERAAVILYLESLK